MKSRYLAALLLLVAGCSGSTTEGPTASGSELERKRIAAEEAADDSGDVCAQNEWYGDGQCDSFCPGADTDCVPSSDPVVCADFEETPDGAIVAGGRIGGGDVDSAGDHRCAMSFAVAGLVAADTVRIADCANVATSFPGFTALANGCGFGLE